MIAVRCGPDRSLPGYGVDTGFFLTSLGQYYEAAFLHYSDTLNHLTKPANCPVSDGDYREKTRVPSAKMADEFPFDLMLHPIDSGLPAFGAFPDDPHIDKNDIALDLLTNTSRPATMSEGQ